MTLTDACAMARMDPFSKYTGAMAKRKSLTGREYWLIWINEEWDPIVRRWFPPKDVEDDGLVTSDLCRESDGGSPGDYYSEPDWQPATYNTDAMFREFINSHILDLTFRIAD